MPSKNEVIEFLNGYEMNYGKVIEFLKINCKITKGFAAQRVGLEASSATTTGLITHILGSLNELTDQEEATLKKEILFFKKDNDAFDDSAFGSQLYTCVWATSQCLLGLLSLKNISQKEVENSIKWLCKMQSNTGGWSFSGIEEDKIIYAPYSIMALIKYYKKFKDENILPYLKKTYTYATEFKPQSEIDKIIKEWLIRYIDESVIHDRRKQEVEIKINFAELVEREFSSYIIYEHSIYPFSMQYYTPASYLFTRKFLPPDHPFNLYLIKYLITNQTNGAYWSHVTSQDKYVPYSFCTAFSIYALYFWAYDVLKSKVKFKSFPSSEELKHQIYNVSYRPPRTFISHSSGDNKIAKKIANSLVERGYAVWLDEWEIKVGDSIIDKMNKGIVESDFLMILLSQNSIKSDWVTVELNAAKMKEMSKKKVFILPVLLEDCEIPALISDKRYADLRTSYREGVKELLKVLEGVKHESWKRNT